MPSGKFQILFGEMSPHFKNTLLSYLMVMVSPKYY